MRKIIIFTILIIVLSSFALGADQYTKLQLGMDGDESSPQHTVTVNGNPQFNGFF